MHHVPTPRRIQRSARRLTTVLLPILVLALTAAAPASQAVPPSYDSRPGTCAGKEGVTVVLDMAPTAGAAPTDDVTTRCVFGTPADGIDALDRAGFDYATDSSFGAPFVCSIESLPDPCDVFGPGYWAAWNGTDAGWEYSMLGAGDDRPVPGDVRGWRWVGHYANDPTDPPRVDPRPLRLTGSPATSVLAGSSTTVTFAVQAAPTTVLCRVDLGAWTACTTGGSHTAADVALGSHVLHVRAIDQWSNAHEVEHAFTAIAPAPVIVSSSVDGVGADGATVRALVRAGGVERLAHVEYAAGAVGPGTETVSSAAHTVGASGEQQLAFRLAGLAGNVEYSWRVVVDGNGASAATAWSSLRTPRSGEVLDVRVPALANPGERVAITVGRLAADEAYTVRLAGADVATGRANARGSARVVVPIARTARSGELAVTVVGDQADRTGSAQVQVLGASRLAVTTGRAAVAVGGLQTIVVTGLAPGEAVTVVHGGVTLARPNAIADRTGRYATSIGVGRRTGTRSIVVRGDHAARVGSTSYRVVALRRAALRATATRR